MTIVEGDIIAGKKIEMGRAAKVSGNIQTPALVIEQGAVFEGHCSMSEKKDEAAPAAEEKRMAAPFSSRSKLGPVPRSKSNEP